MILGSRASLVKASSCFQAVGRAATARKANGIHQKMFTLSSRVNLTKSGSNSYSSLAAAPVANINSTPAEAEYRSSRVAVEIDKVPHNFSTLVLRDLCQCPLCVHPSTRQKLFSTADVPLEIQARSITSPASKPNSVQIFWDHDVPGFDSSHSTELNVDVLRKITNSGSPLNSNNDAFDEQNLWNAENCKITDFDYESYMHDDTTLFQALRQLHQYGLLFLTNVPGTEESVATIARRIGPVKDTLYGHTWDVRSVPAAINAAYTSQDLGFHTDLLYTHNPPHIQLLHCIQSSSIGGASVFSDGYKAAADLFDLDLDAFNDLATLPVNYHYNHPDSNIYQTTKPVIGLRPLRIGERVYSTVKDFLDDWETGRDRLGQGTNRTFPPLRVADCLDKINWGPPFMAPFSLQEETMEHSDGSIPSCEGLNQKVDQWHLAARKFNHLLNRPNMLYERVMQPGECVLFDNTRVLHSRKAFNSSDVGKARWLRGTYVDKDPFLSKMKVLKNSVN